MSYPGGKGAPGVYQTIINQQPPHDVYIEPFLGGGAVMRAKRPAARNIGIDVDPGAIAGFAAAPSSADPTLITGDAAAFLSGYQWTGRELVYCDPPYLMESRARKRDLYTHEMARVDEHRELLALVRSLPCMIQVSSYWHPLHVEMLEGWRLLRFQGWSRGGATEECLWMNYPEPVLLHDYRYVGRSFRERERIQRKVRRWCARMARQGDIDRIALLSAMAAETVFSIPGGARRPSTPEAAI